MPVIVIIKITENVEMGLEDDRCLDLLLAAEIHDVGKINIPAEILNKPGLLSKTEFALIKTTPWEVAKILEKFDLLWPINKNVLQHHERFDGSGRVPT